MSIDGFWVMKVGFLGLGKNDLLGAQKNDCGAAVLLCWLRTKIQRRSRGFT